jgi:hypothetical protein
MTQLIRCDQCGRTATVDQQDAWLMTCDLDADDEVSYWHFCCWPCLSTYASAKALVDS